MNTIASGLTLHRTICALSAAFGLALVPGCAAEADSGDEPAVSDDVSESSDAYTGSNSCTQVNNGRTLRMTASFVSRTNPWLVRIAFSGYPYTTKNDAYITLRRADGTWFKVHTPDNILYNETRTFDLRNLSIVACSSSPCSMAIEGPSAANEYSPGNSYTVQGVFDIPLAADPRCNALIVM